VGLFVGGKGIEYAGDHGNLFVNRAQNNIRLMKMNSSLIHSFAP